MSRELTILQINDTHGYVAEHQELFWDGEIGATRSRAATPASPATSSRCAPSAGPTR